MAPTQRAGAGSERRETVVSKKQDAFYFETFNACADYACQAAHLLEAALTDFDPEELGQKLDDIHRVEHAADERKHEMLHVLMRAFITPIEREDIILLSRCIDEITDKVEDVLLRVYCNNIQYIREDSIQLIQVVIRCCEEVKRLVGELADFKRSKVLHNHIVSLNTMEEEADRLFIASMRRLHTTCSDPVEIITWREIYIYLEKCADACEHVADAVESIVMKNS